MARIRLLVLRFVVALAVFMPQGAFAMKASFSWAGIPACNSISPAFAIADAPAGTQSLRFVLHDRDAPAFHHGGSTVAYAGGQVPQGAITYIGPCPPQGQVHHYVWTIEAIDAAGKVLAKTTAAGEFPVK